MRHGPVHTVTVVSLSILAGGQSALLHAQATFNMDLLEKNDHLPAVDLQRFNQQAASRRAYPVSWQVNGVTLDAVRPSRFARTIADSSRPALSRKICCRPELTRPCCPRRPAQRPAHVPNSTHCCRAARSISILLTAAGNDHSSGADDAPARIMFPLRCGTKVLAPFRVTIVIQAPASVPARAAPSAITI